MKNQKMQSLSLAVREGVLVMLRLLHSWCWGPPSSSRLFTCLGPTKICLNVECNIGFNYSQCLFFSLANELIGFRLLFSFPLATFTFEC